MVLQVLRDNSQQSISIFYKSDWDPALLHSCVIDSAGHESEWKELPFESGESIGMLGWHYICLNNVTHGMRFVCCNFLKTQWDNPPPETGLKNYHIQTDPNKPAQIFSLCDGKLSDITGEPVALVTDLDGTLLGNDKALDRFKRFWEQQHIWRGSLLIYSTGRNLKDFLTVCHDQQLPRPDYAVCGVGTEVYTFPAGGAVKPENSHLARTDIAAWIARGVQPEDFNCQIQDEKIRFPKWCPSRYHAVIDREWEGRISSSFDRMATSDLITEMLPDGHINGSAYHDPYRISVSIRSDDLFPVDKDINLRVHELMTIFKDYHLFISGGEEWKYLDVVPSNGGKRAAMEYICLECRKIPPKSVLVCGDSGNDVDMFTSPGVKGCCVGNAQSDLVKFLRKNQNDDQEVMAERLSGVTLLMAQKRGIAPIDQINFSTLDCADAILESLGVFGFDDVNHINEIITN